jgi:hypothetical protein
MNYRIIAPYVCPSLPPSFDPLSRVKTLEKRYFEIYGIRYFGCYCKIL